jgi:hypothetical protein
MSDPCHGAEDGAGRDRSPGHRREDPAAAQPPAPLDDRWNVDGFLRVFRRLKRPAQGVQIGHRLSPPIAGAGTAGSALTRSLASARELVLFTVPTEMPKSRATVASGRSNK